MSKDIHVEISPVSVPVKKKDILDETPPEVLQAVVQNQIQQWKTARVDLVISRRVAVTIGDDTKAIDDRLKKVEIALTELEKLLDDKIDPD